MNRYDFTQPGGFPFDQDILANMQGATQLAGLATLFGGPLCILKGCVQTGSSVSAGVVSIDGEPFDFEAGTASTSVIIAETTNGLTYEDGSTKGSEKIRVVRFGSDGVTDRPWADFVRIPAAGLVGPVANAIAFMANFGTWQTSTDTTGAAVTGGTFNTLSRKWIRLGQAVTLSFEAEITTSVARVLVASIPIAINAANSSTNIDVAVMAIRVSGGSGSYIGRVWNGGSGSNATTLQLGSQESLPIGTYLLRGQITYQVA